jgi:glyoxylase I family protein
MGVLRLSHVGLCVADRDRSLAFYRDVLGFRFVSEIRIAGEPAATLLQISEVDLHASYLERDGFRLELLYYASPGHQGAGRLNPMNRLGLTHLSFRVEDLAGLLGHLRSQGVPVIEASHIEIPSVAAAAVFITDPDGTLIELVQSPGDPNLLPGE